MFVCNMFMFFNNTHLYLYTSCDEDLSASVILCSFLGNGLTLVC